MSWVKHSTSRNIRPEKTANGKGVPVLTAKRNQNNFKFFPVLFIREKTAICCAEHKYLAWLL